MCRAGGEGGGKEPEILRPSRLTPGKWGVAALRGKSIY